MIAIEDVSDSMTRSTGVQGTYFSVFDGKNFWYTHIKANGIVIYDENQSILSTSNEDVYELVNNALKEQLDGKG